MGEDPILSFVFCPQSSRVKDLSINPHNYTESSSCKAPSENHPHTPKHPPPPTPPPPPTHSPAAPDASSARFSSRRCTGCTSAASPALAPAPTASRCASRRGWRAPRRRRREKKRARESTDVGGGGGKMEKTGGLGGRGRSVGVIGSNVAIQRFNTLV